MTDALQVALEYGSLGVLALFIVIFIWYISKRDLHMVDKDIRFMDQLDKWISATNHREMDSRNT